MAVLLAALVTMLFFSNRERSLVNGGSGWTVTGVFERQGVYPTTRMEPSVDPSEYAGTIFWGSWAGDDHNTGELSSPEFRAPAIMGIFVAGYPDKPANGIFLERQDTRTRIAMRVRSDFEPRERWKDLYWWVPPDWWGKTVRLVAVDHETGSGGWLGVSSPRAVPIVGLLRKQGAAVLPVLLFALTFGLFILPGFAVALWIADGWQVRVVDSVILAVTVSSFLGYVAFWIYLSSQLMGQV